MPFGLLLVFQSISDVFKFLENFDDGLNVTELLMTAYMSAEQGKTISFPPPNLDTFVPSVAKGEWNPKNK